MKKIFLILFLLSVCNLAFAQKEQNHCFVPGESLTYVLNYTWGGVSTNVGEAVTDISYSNGMYKSVIKGYTYKFYDIIFKVREHFESEFYADSLKPYKFYRKTQEGKYRITSSALYNNKDYTIQTHIKKNDDPEIDTLMQGNKYTQDLPSLFYKIRSLDFANLEPGAELFLSFAIDDDVHNINYTYEGKEEKKIQRVGTFKALKFTAYLKTGKIFTGEEPITVWVTDDENKIPLCFEAPIFVGTVYGVLKAYKNTKTPLTSKIK